MLVTSSIAPPAPPNSCSIITHWTCTPVHTLVAQSKKEPGEKPLQTLEVVQVGTSWA